MADDETVELTTHAKTIAGMPWFWDLEQGDLQLFGLPSVAFWTRPSLQRLLGPLRREVGDPLYRLLVAHYSSLGTEEDYHAMITELGTDFPSGFMAWGRAVSTAGWGRFELVEFDPDSKRAQVRVDNPWELQMQGPGESWGCPFLQGKLIGIFTHALGVNCWADEAIERDGDRSAVVFTVTPSSRTIEVELSALRREQMRVRERALADEIARKTEALREIEERQRAVLSSIGDLVFTADRGGRIRHYQVPADQRDAFPPAQAVLGQTIEAVFGVTLAKVVAAQLEAGEGHNSRSVDFHSIAPVACGTERHYDARSTVRAGSTGTLEGVTVVVRDVTRQRQLEVQLRHSQKMESVGLLASGVAHDFNNILMGIMGAADLLTATSEGNTRELAETVVEGAETAASLIQRLLDFSRKGQRVERAVDVHAVIRDTARLLERAVERRVEIQCRLEASSHTIRGDAHQLQSALLNLGVNSRDAMPEGGTLRFQTRTVVVGEAGLATRTGMLAAGAYLEISVEDTGEGMDADTVTKIFEPFFTTKAEGKGTGLGLAAVHGAISDHRGGIEVESQPGVGTRFALLLPLSEGAVAGADAGKESEVGGRRRGRILLVDDEPIVRAVGEQLLTKLGYEVSLAEDGRSAIEGYRETHASVDLVILDLVMPQMSGHDVARELRSIDPAVRLLFSSGFSRKGLAPQDAAGFIKKPYRLADLRKAIDRVLDEDER